MPRIKCTQCKKPQGYCYCDLLVRHNNQWPVWILQHPNEVKHALGTGRIAHLSLKNSKLITGRKVSDCSEFADSIERKQPLLVFPSEHSVSLPEVSVSQLVDATQPLLFLDATWRKAKRMMYESPELKDLRHVHLVSHECSRYKIRKAPQLRKSFGDPVGFKDNQEPLTAQPLSTLEAIVQSLRCLEDDANGYQSLLDVMDWMIQRQIESMGDSTYENNY